MTEQKTQIYKGKQQVASYASLKDQLLQCIIARKTFKVATQELGISKNTFFKYRRKLIAELGDLNSDRCKQIKEEYVTKALAEIDLAKRIPLNSLGSSEEKTRLSAVNSLVGLLKAETEILGRLRVIDSEVVIHNTSVSSIEQLAAIYAEANKDEKDV